MIIINKTIANWWWLFAAGWALGCKCAFCYRTSFQFARSKRCWWCWDIFNDFFSWRGIKEDLTCFFSSMETSVKTLNFLSMLYLMMIMFVLMLVSKRNKNESYQVFFNDSQWHKIDITRNAEKVDNIIL